MLSSSVRCSLFPSPVRAHAQGALCYCMCRYSQYHCYHPTDIKGDAGSKLRSYNFVWMMDPTLWGAQELCLQGRSSVGRLTHCPWRLSHGAGCTRTPVWRNSISSPASACFKVDEMALATRDQQAGSSTDEFLHKLMLPSF